MVIVVGVQFVFTAACLRHVSVLHFPFLLPPNHLSSRIMELFRWERKQPFQYDADARLLNRETIDKLWAATMNTPEIEDSRAQLAAAVPTMSESNSSDEDGPAMQPPLRITVIGEQYQNFVHGQFSVLKDSFADQMPLFPLTDWQVFQTWFKEKALRNALPAARRQGKEIIMKPRVQTRPASNLFLGIFGTGSREWTLTRHNWEEVKEALRDGETETIKVSYWIKDRRL